MIRRLVALALAGICLRVHAATGVTVAQLEAFLVSPQASREDDAAEADQLGAVTLTERLTRSRLESIASKTRLGPEAMEQLELLCAASIFQSPPAAEIPPRAVPDSARQQEILRAASGYVGGFLLHLPDFLATRVTLSFADTPQARRKPRAKPRVILHFTAQSRQEIAYRRNLESDTPGVADLAVDGSRPSLPPGLTTWGEFGPVLEIVLGDSIRGGMVWSRWEVDASGADTAVFRYQVPRPTSHYLLDFCCYQESASRPEPIRFRDQPAYHGEISVHPETGVIARITVEPEFDPASPVRFSGMAVEYGPIDIGGVNAVCPTRSVAVSEIRTLEPAAPDGFETRRFLNQVHFVDYHKFGSTARIVPSP